MKKHSGSEGFDLVFFRVYKVYLKSQTAAVGLSKCRLVSAK